MAYTSIDDPSAHFQTTLYTGNGADNHAITNDGNSDLQPDWVWIKYRPAGVSHVTYDSSRGATKRLYVDFASTEATQAAGVKSFDSDGFTLGTAGASNGSGITFVSWQWHANSGTTSSNSSGSITSTVQANTDAGFSIVQYTGTGTAATIGHGLGVAPAMYIVKNRDQTGTNWTVFHKDLTSNAYHLYLNDSAAQSNSVGYWNSTSPTSTVFSIKNTSGDVNTNTEDYVVYCFAEKQGFSKFSGYVGVGSSGVGVNPFAFTGFKPAFIMIKAASTTGSWMIYDHKRLGYNPIDVALRANGSDAEGTALISGDDINIHSNGFKIITSDNTLNNENEDYIYMAFAENPFVTSTGIPTTAR
jgi:hypothetical protein